MSKRDVDLASVSQADILLFGLPSPDKNLMESARRANVRVTSHTVIYDLFDTVQVSALMVSSRGSSFLIPAPL